MGKFSNTPNLPFSSQDMSANATSDLVDLAGTKGCSVHLTSPASGTRAGSIYIEISNTRTDADFVTLVTVPVTASTLLNTLVSVDSEIKAHYLRIRWKKTGTVTGALTATVFSDLK